MPAANNSQVDYVVGQPETLEGGRPLAALDERACAFLAALSSALLADPKAKVFSDVVAFAYWCRRANIIKLKEAFGIEEVRLGWGTAFHVTPSNVPVNFAFSFAFSLLAGNANIVRLPTRPFPQVAAICEVVKRLLDLPEHAEIKQLTVFVRYEQNEEVTAAFSRICQARLIWGGDMAVNAIRKIPIPERCVEIAFTDRYSFCVLDGAAVASTTPLELENLAAGFFNDAYLFDQNACSSPRLVVWVGREADVERAKDRFWPAVTTLVKQRYAIQPVNVVEKYTFLCASVMDHRWIRRVHRHGNYVYRLEVEEVPANVDTVAGRNGVFFECTASSLDIMAHTVNTRYQTLTYFGIDRKRLRDFVLGSRAKGIDRVVPVGMALDIGAVWDGYDLLRSLSRVVNFK